MAIDEWEVETMHSGIYFSVNHMVVGKVRGRFGRWSATVRAEDDDLERTALDVVIDASSISTGVPGRDGHLKSAAFFDVTKYPVISFKSSRVEKLDATHLRLTGELTIRDVTRTAIFEVEDAGRSTDRSGRPRAGFTARTSIDRRDFGLTWNEVLDTGGVLIGERVEIEVEVEMIRLLRPRPADQPRQPTWIRASSGQERGPS
jgi:polyisoprenoid-binding protein YceI